MLDICLNHRIGYFGEQRDKESDYFAMGFRLYDPEIGRFLAIDPLLDVQPSQTPYHYCFNNPTSFTDPTGLYPEKEKGDKVQMSEINYWAFEEAWQSLMNSRIQYEENWQMARRQWRDLFYLISDKKYNDRMYGNGGGGGSSSGRVGTRYGSMSYSINGVEGKIIYRFKDGQDKELIEKKLKDGLDWQCKDDETRNELTEYFIKGYELKVDVSISGKYLSSLYNEQYKEDTKYLNGILTSNWKTNDPNNTLLPPIPGLEIGCIYIASEFLNNERNYDAGKYTTYTSQFLFFLFGTDPYYVDFNLTFSHETGHRLDSFNFFIDEIDVEENAYERTMRQYQLNNNGRRIKIP